MDQSLRASLAACHASTVALWRPLHSSSLPSVSNSQASRDGSMSGSGGRSAPSHSVASIAGGGGNSACGTIGPGLDEQAACAIRGSAVRSRRGDIAIYLSDFRFDNRLLCIQPGAEFIERQRGAINGAPTGGLCLTNTFDGFRLRDQCGLGCRLGRLVMHVVSDGVADEPSNREAESEADEGERF